MSERFTLDPIDRYSKHAVLNDTESEFCAEIDTDDVPRDEVLQVAQSIADVLNAHADEIVVPTYEFEEDE